MSEQARLPDRARETRRRDLKPLRRVIPFLAPYGWRVAVAAVALVVAAGTVLSLGQGMRLVIDEGFAGGDSAMLDYGLALVLAAVVLLGIATYARFYMVTWIGERVVADIRCAVYSHVLSLPPAFFETTRTGEILSRLTADTSVLQVVVGSSASVALRNLLMLVGGLVMLLITSAKLTGLVLLVVPLVLAPIILIGRRVRALSRASQDRVADVGAYVEETLGAIRTVQAFTHEGRDRRLFAVRVEDAFDTAIHRTRLRAMLTMMVIVLIFGAVGIILWVGGHDVLAGRLTPGELSAFVLYAIVVAGSVGAISEVVGDLQRASGATERLFELLDTPSDITAPPSPKTLPEPARGALRFEGVTFRYPSRPDQPSLEGFDLAIAPGETVALVGPSGAGKTTVFQLLLRFYDPQLGRVLLDGVDLRDADPAAIRRRIGIVSQDPVLFSANAWENIRYGRPDASDAEVLAAARDANAQDFLEALPDGLNSFLGEKGVRLSGGQRQRIAIARAILRDPPVLLLDEATSALDAESERVVQAALDRLKAGRTTVTVAHRLATVVNADRIIVMENGRVAASGRHAELVEDGGLYARLAALQFGEARPL